MPTYDTGSTFGQRRSGSSANVVSPATPMPSNLIQNDMALAPTVAFVADAIAGADNDLIATWTATKDTSNTLTAVTGTGMTSPVLKVDASGRRFLRFVGTSKLRTNTTFGTALQAFASGADPADNFSLTVVLRCRSTGAQGLRDVNLCRMDFRYQFALSSSSALGNNQPRYLKALGTTRNTQPATLRMLRKSWQVITYQVRKNADGSRTVSTFFDGQLDGTFTVATLALWVDSSYTSGTSIDFLGNFVDTGTGNPHFVGDVSRIEMHNTALTQTQVETYQKRLLANINLQPENTINLNASNPLIIGVVGDSNLEPGYLFEGGATGIALVTYPERLATNLTTELGAAPVIVNVALAGRTSLAYATIAQLGNLAEATSWANLLLPAAAERVPDICIVQIGTNDGLLPQPNATTRACIAGIIDNILSNGIRYCVVNFIPPRDRVNITAAVDYTNSVNQAIFDVTEAAKLKYPGRVIFGVVDAYADLITEETKQFYYRVNNFGFGGDTIHPNQKCIDERIAPELTRNVRTLIRGLGLKQTT